MQDAFGRKAIHTALRPLTSTYSAGLFCGAGIRDFRTPAAHGGTDRQLRDVRAKRARAAGMSPAARALRSDVVRRAASRGGTLRCAEARRVAYRDVDKSYASHRQSQRGGREATSRQRRCHSASGGRLSPFAPLQMKSMADEEGALPLHLAVSAARHPF